MGNEQTSIGPDEIAERAAAVGLTAAELARRADIFPTTFYRWRKRKHGININTYNRIIEVLRAAERKKGIALSLAADSSQRADKGPVA